MKRLTYVWSTIGLLLILFAVFLMFQMPGMPAWGTVKLTDILMIVGGLLFIVPIYMDSLRRKDGDGAPNRWVWATLPPIGPWSSSRCSRWRTCSIWSAAC